MKTVGVRGAIDSGGYSAPAATKTHSEMSELLIELELEALKAIYPVSPPGCKTTVIPPPLTSIVTDLQTKKFSEAHQLLTSALQNDNSYKIRDLLAFTEQLSGNFEAAAEQFRLAANVSSSARENFAWGANLLLLGNPDSALNAFDKGLTKHEDSSLSVIGKGMALTDKGQTTLALQIFLSAAERKPPSFYPYAFVAKILSLPGRAAQEGTESRLKKLIDLAPDNAEAYFAYACSLRKRAEAAQAPQYSQRIEDLLKRVIALNPDLADAHSLLGTLLFEKGQYNLAAAEYRKALEENPGLPELHYRLAQTYMRNGQKSLAEQEFAAHKDALRTSNDPASTPEMYSRFMAFARKLNKATGCDGALP
jgi:tetratricopeptide (TPR) repeat protein